MSRSSTCWRSSSSGGCSPPRWAMVLRTSFSRLVYWLCMMMPSSTMAAMRSRGCSAAKLLPVASASARHRAFIGLIAMLLTSLIARDAFIEEGAYLVAGYTAQALEDDLQEYATVGATVVFGRHAALVIIDPVTLDQADFPAAVAVFKAAKGVQGAALVVVKLPAGDGIPALEHRPHDGGIGLLDFVEVFVNFFAAVRQCVRVVTTADYVATSIVVIVDTVVAVAVAQVDDFV